MDWSHTAVHKSKVCTLLAKHVCGSGHINTHTRCVLNFLSSGFVAASPIMDTTACMVLCVYTTAGITCPCIITLDNFDFEYNHVKTRQTSGKTDTHIHTYTHTHTHTLTDRPYI